MRSSRLASSTANNGPLSPEVIEVAFGVDSVIFVESIDRLTRIYSQASHIPQVSGRFREWQARQHVTRDETPPGESAFIEQTYVALLVRLIARGFVAPDRPIANAEELFEVTNFDYFSRRGISNFGEGDIFSWLLIEPRWELDVRDLVFQTLQALADAVALHDFTHATPGILDSLIPVSLTIPRWLAEYVVGDELGLADDPNLSLVDPACGTGAFLCAAISAISQAIEKQGGDQMDVMFNAPDKIRGMDSNPLSVSLTRLNYLLALGSLVQEEHPPFLMPVYLADRDTVHQPISSDTSTTVLKTTAGEFLLPEPLIDNPMMLDWLLGRLTNYMDGAQLRLHVQSEEVAFQEVLNSYYNYLTAAKPRTPVPDALTPVQADTLLQTARRLIELHIQGEGTLWLHLVQNMAATTVLSKRGFDRLASVGQRDLFESDSNTYLRQEGKAAMVIPLAEAETSAEGYRLVNLNNYLSETALLVGESEKGVRLELAGEPIPNEFSWENAKSKVRLVEKD